MDDLLRLLLTNAGAALLIAVLAWAASLTVRRQAVVHGLWLLALLRLVTPPIAPLPVVPDWPRLSLAPAPATPTVVAIPLASPERVLHEPVALPTTLHAFGRPAHRSGRRDRLRRVPGRPRPLAPGPGVPGWRTVAWLLLLAGALVVVLGLTAWRFARFGRLLACARPAPDSLVARVAALAPRLGLRRVPPVLLVPARIPPMLWPHRGGPRLLLPAEMLPRLQAEELDALLAHELAHVRRRDHWVRLVEIAATALFWWYPRHVVGEARPATRGGALLRRVGAPRAAALRRGLRERPPQEPDLRRRRLGVPPGPRLRRRPGRRPRSPPEGDPDDPTRSAPRLPLRLALAAAAVVGLAVFPTHAQSSATKDEPATPSRRIDAGGSPCSSGRSAGAGRACRPRPPGDASGSRPAPALAPRPGQPPVAALSPLPALAPVAAPAPAPQAAPAPAPEPAIAGHRRTSDPARRALDDQRRAIEEKRRQLHQQELELGRQQVELEAQAEQAELRAEADRLRAAGQTEDAARVEQQVRLNAQRVELQKRQLGLELERAALEAKVEADVRAQEDRLVAVEEGTREALEEDARREIEEVEEARQQVELEIEKKQQALEAEMSAADEQMQALAAEDQVGAMRSATDELARSLAEQIESLKQAAAEAPSQKAAAEHEIQRLQAALDALQSSGTPRSLPRKSPRP